MYSRYNTTDDKLSMNDDRIKMVYPSEEGRSRTAELENNSTASELIIQLNEALKVCLSYYIAINKRNINVITSVFRGAMMSCSLENY